MVNILLELYNIDANWISCELKKYIKPEHKVAVIAFSFRDHMVHDSHDWDLLYGKNTGKYYSGIVNSLCFYGIPEENITFVNYFTDTEASAAEKIAQADIIYFPGGLPDRMMDRIKEFNLYDILLNHDGIVMGYSAGALIQLTDYHLSPDKDYSAFGYYKGLPYLDGFYLEVHYESSDVQNASIRRVTQERKVPVYAPHFGRGAIIAENGVIRTVGEVEVFR